MKTQIKKSKPTLMSKPLKNFILNFSIYHIKMEKINKL